MKNKIFLLIAVVAMTMQVAAQSWIWYPGDMDIWTGNIINNLRTERGSFYPAFWRADSHEQTVEYVKTVELTDAVRFWQQQSGATAIRSATAIAKQSDTIYSLNGTRRNAMQKGVNIINGRKIITK